MRIYLTLFSVALLIVSQSALAQSARSNGKAMQYNENFNQSAPYVGVDVVGVSVTHQYKSLFGYPADVNGEKSKARSLGAGLNLGYKMAFYDFFVAPELFYEYLNNSAKDFGYHTDSAVKDNSLNIKQRYGAKINLGYYLFSRVSVIANAGIANVDYDLRLLDQNTIRDGTKSSAIFGLGANYDLDKNWKLKLAYDRQDFHLRYNRDSERNVIHINTLKFGLIYSF